MRIIHLVNDLDNSFGGPARSVPELAAYLQHMNVSQTLISIKSNELQNNSVINENSLDWKSFEGKYFKKLYYSPDLMKNLKQIVLSEIVIIHVHAMWTYPIFCLSRLVKEFNIPIIYSVRANLYKESLKNSKYLKLIAWYLFQKKLFESSNCFHVTDHRSIQAIRNMGFKNPIALVSNGISLSEFVDLPTKQEAKRKLGLRADKKYLLFLSRIHPRKRLDLLIKTWFTLCSSFQEWDLLIYGPVGDKKYMNKIMSIIRDNDQSDRVLIKDMIVGRERLLAHTAADLFVLPSYFENYGMAIAEALASRTPVIATKGSPWCDIRRKNAGWWINSDEKSLTIALKEAFELNESALEEKGNNGHNLIKNSHDWHNRATEMKAVYKWMLDGEKRPNIIY